MCVFGRYLRGYKIVSSLSMTSGVRLAHQTSIPHGSPLLAQPTPRRLALALQYDCVALQPIRHVVPCRRDEFVFAAKGFDFLL
jgi:hypothetical protein